MPDDEERGWKQSDERLIAIDNHQPTAHMMINREKGSFSRGDD